MAKISKLYSLFI